MSPKKHLANRHWPHSLRSMSNLAKFMWVQAIMTGHRYGRLEGLRVS